MASKDEFVIHERDQLNVSNACSSNDATTSFAMSVRMQLLANVLRSIFECLLFYLSLLSSFTLILTYYYQVSIDGVSFNENVSINKTIVSHYQNSDAKSMRANNQLWLWISACIFIVAYCVRTCLCINIKAARIYSDVDNFKIGRVCLQIASTFLQLDFFIWYFRFLKLVYSNKINLFATF